MKPLKISVVLALLLIFLTMSWNAVEKYLAKDTTFTESDQFKERLPLPGIAICPIVGRQGLNISNLKGDNADFDLVAVTSAEKTIQGEELKQFVTYPRGLSGHGVSVCVRYENTVGKTAGMLNGVMSFQELFWVIFILSVILHVVGAQDQQAGIKRNYRIISLRVLL